MEQDEQALWAISGVLLAACTIAAAIIVLLWPVLAMSSLCVPEPGWYIVLWGTSIKPVYAILLALDTAWMIGFFARAGISFEKMREKLYEARNRAIQQDYFGDDRPHLRSKVAELQGEVQQLRTLLHGKVI